jgi:hypothetical protein
MKIYLMIVPCSEVNGPKREMEAEVPEAIMEEIYGKRSWAFAAAALRPYFPEDHFLVNYGRISHAQSAKTAWFREG